MKSVSDCLRSCSLSNSSRNGNDENSRLNDNNHYVKKQNIHKKNKLYLDVDNRMKQNRNHWNSNHKSPAIRTNIFAIHDPHINSNKNINDGSISNNFEYKKEHFLKPYYPGMHPKNKNISVLLRNNISSNKKDTSFLLGMNDNYSLSSSRRKSPISILGSKENQKLLSSSKSSKHLNFKNIINQSF